MDVARREWICGFGAAAAVGILGQNAFPFSRNTILTTATADELLGTLGQALDFEVDWEGEAYLAGPERALYELYQLNGLRWEFSDRVGYREASQCADNFRSLEAGFRSEKATHFTDVERSPFDADIAYMTAGEYARQSGILNARGTVQFQGNAALLLAGEDPGIILAGTRIYQDVYRPIHARDLARVTAVADVSEVSTQVPGGYLQGRKYSTPNVDTYHFPTPVNVGRRRYNRGLVGIRRKNSRDSMKFRGIYV